MQKHKKNTVEFKKYFFFQNKKFKVKKNNYSIRSWKFKKNFKIIKLKKTFFDRKVCLRLSSNNVFFTLLDLTKKTPIVVGTSGKYRIKITKKRLKKTIIRVLTIFIKDIKQYLSRNGIIIMLIAPIKLRKRIIKLLKLLRTYKIKRKKKKLLGYRPLIIKAISKKAFNGCRAAKKRRKKRKGRRIFKY